jgi:hypothetical protein
VKSELSEAVDHINFWNAQIRMHTLDKIRRAIGGRKSTVNYGPKGQTFVNLPEKSIEVLETDTVDDIKAKLQNPFEGKRMPTIGEQLKAAKAEIAAVRQDAANTVVDTQDAVKLAQQEVDKAKKEAADLRAELAELTNGGPL